MPRAQDRAPDSPGKVRLEPLEAGDFSLIRPWIDPRVFRIYREPVDGRRLDRLLTRYENDRPTSPGYRIVHSSDSAMVGFEIDGLMREATRTDDGYVSWFSMSILAREWDRPRPR